MSPDDRPPRKRARVDDGEHGDQDGGPAQNEPAPALRDKDVWFPDGNIVVIAKEKVAFRVHQGILSLRSETFRDLFSLPKADAAGATDSETFDGCPAFRVEDAPEDIRRLFLVICCGKNYYYDQDTLVPVPFDVLASLIRMADKYLIDDVLDEAISRLGKYYTTDLAAWQDPDGRARYVTTVPEDALTVVQLAWVTGTPSLAPTAYLTCVALSTRCWGQPESVFRYPLAGLSSQDMAFVLEGKGRLTQAAATRALTLLSALPSLRCTTRDACTAVREEPLAALREDGRLPVALSDEDAFRPIAERMWPEPHWGAFCESCRQALSRTDAREMQSLWDDLPSQFRIGIDRNSWPRDDSESAGQSNLGPSLALALVTQCTVTPFQSSDSTLFYGIRASPHPVEHDLALAPALVVPAHDSEAQSDNAFVVRRPCDLRVMEPRWVLQSHQDSTPLK
ncbi:hypothetical protein GSI_04733 [Ganoderma sinense ZZ0214-1]|uniref:BTB domain-containing protein n=1 Tax=Ganoderma sinense ZZ0214-1 TaxID=1077348 RepID=A0A2G8SHP6_9APHY|nr:hypothetical protein GSI_04733 [Ganoderma sinense ZZ0214-1]